METKINVVVAEANYDHYPDIVDVNLALLNSYSKPLVICAREGQKTRLLKAKEEGHHKAEVLGWWDYRGEVKDLAQYDVVVVIDPYRIGLDRVRECWEKIIEIWA